MPLSVTQEQRLASLAWQVEEVKTTLILRLGLTVRRRDTSSLASTDTAPRPPLSSLVKPWGQLLLLFSLTSLIAAISSLCLLQSPSSSKGSLPESLV